MTTSFRSIIRAAGAVAVLAAATGCSKSDPVPPTLNSEYDLELRWLGTPPEGLTLEAFNDAATVVRGIIVGGLSSVGLPRNFTNVSQCDASLSGFPDVPRDPIPGLVIYIRLQAIDGVGGTLGSAGPCLVRQDSQGSLPALGVMRLDEADVANLLNNGRLGAVILHEMLHVVGFGTVWFDNQMLDTTLATDARFLGTRARAACADLHAGGSNCATTVPVHSTDGAGSRHSHWRESLFTNELMTPFLNNVAVNPLSAMTIQSLADLGYVVSTTPAQPFTVAGTMLRTMADAESEPLLRFAEPMRPRYSIDVNGDLVPYRWSTR